MYIGLDTICILQHNRWKLTSLMGMFSKYIDYIIRCLMQVVEGKPRNHISKHIKNSEKHPTMDKQKQNRILN